MFRWICHACRCGNHASCAGTRNPLPGRMGGSTCICKHDAESENVTLSEIRGQLQIMLASAEEIVDERGWIVGYKIKTGALHNVVGLLSLTIPRSATKGDTKP